MKKLQEFATYYGFSPSKNGHRLEIGAHCVEVASVADENQHMAELLRARQQLELLAKQHGWAGPYLVEADPRLIGARPDRV